MLTPRTVATEPELDAWRARRRRIGDRVEALVTQGRCYQCVDLATDGVVLERQPVMLETATAKVVPAMDPRAPGHTIVIWKRHVRDLDGLDDNETAALARLCRDVARALRASLHGIERVYHVSMCDGPVNHLHVQLIPRFAGTAIGSSRLVDPRGPLLDGDLLARTVHAELGSVRG